MTVLVRTWKNVRGSLVEKACVVGFKEYPSHPEQTGNKNIEGNTGEVSDGNEEHFIRKWRRGISGWLSQLIICL